MVRFHNHLPSVTKPQNFGIAEMTTHLHNGHTPSESNGYPLNYFNSINDPNPVNPHGFKDQHYPNVLAGYTARGELEDAHRPLLPRERRLDSSEERRVRKECRARGAAYNQKKKKHTGG